MTRKDTSVEETATLDYDVDAEEEWLQEPDELPRRPRRKLLAPVPVVLLAVLVLAGGFLAGVEVEKGQTSSGSSGGSFAAGLAALRNARGAGSASGGGGATRSFFGAGGLPGGGGFGGSVTRGEVSYVNGNTLYVTSGEGNTVKVSAPTGTRVSKTVSTSLHSIHPGDTVAVAGSQASNGSVTAGSISITSSGSGTGTGSSSGSATGSSSAGGAAPQLFGSG